MRAEPKNCVGVTLAKLVDLLGLLAAQGQTYAAKCYYCEFFEYLCMAALRACLCYAVAVAGTTIICGRLEHLLALLLNTFSAKGYFLQLTLIVFVAVLAEVIFAH